MAVTDTVSGEASEIAAEGASVAIGHAPATELFKGKLELDAPVQRLAAPDTPLPCATALEQAYVPSIDRMVEAARRLARW